MEQEKLKRIIVKYFPVIFSMQDSGFDFGAIPGLSKEEQRLVAGAYALWKSNISLVMERERVRKEAVGPYEFAEAYRKFCEYHLSKQWRLFKLRVEN